MELIFQQYVESSQTQYWICVSCIGMQILYRRDMQMKVPQLCLTLEDPMGYTVLGILQARMLEWVAIPLSREIF